MTIFFCLCVITPEFSEFLKMFRIPGVLLVSDRNTITEGILVYYSYIKYIILETYTQTSLLVF